MIDQAGSGYALLVSGSGIAATITNTFTVTSASPTRLVVTAQPSSRVASGKLFGVTIAAEDAFGNRVPTFSGSVTASLAGNVGQNKLGGNLTAVASGGVANFNALSLKHSGRSYTIRLTGTGLTPALTQPITVTSAGARTSLLAPIARNQTLAHNGRSRRDAASDPRRTRHT
jgi:hypothetical protein